MTRLVRVAVKMTLSGLERYMTDVGTRVSVVSMSVTFTW